MSKENIIKKITINIGGKDVEVTPDEAKKLHVALGELLGVTPVKEYVKEYVPYTPYAPLRPYVYPTTPTWPYAGPFYYSGTANEWGYGTATVSYTSTTGEAHLTV